MPREKDPYISFVAVSRNDNHGGDMTKRMVIFVKGLIHQCNKFQLRAELIMVEWNPPEETPFLSEILPQTREEDWLTIRYIRVPKSLHQKINFSDRLPLFQMIAKNIGIRRAHAPFVLCTNIDLLFSDSLMERLARQDLKEGHYYRANRCDIPSEIDENWDVEQQLEFAEKNILKHLGKSDWYPNLVDTTSILFKYWLFIPVFRILSMVKRHITSPLNTKLQEMDTEACGDFTLMSKKDWLAIQGYPELEVYSLHIDSMGLIAANALNIKQVIFPYHARTFHISHLNGWDFSNKKEKLLFYTNKPVLDWWSIYDHGRDLIKEGKTYDINQPDWGFSREELEEVRG